MTNFEKKQPDVVFIDAGKRAFYMGIPIVNNPYKEQPYNRLWEKGYRIAKRRFKGRRI